MDIVDLLSKAVRNYTMKFGVYYSLLEWHNKKYPRKDDISKTYKKQYIDNVMIPDIQQLITDYEPSVLWADGDWDEHSDFWKAKEIFAWIYNDSPVKDEIVINDRWGYFVRNTHGDFFNGDDRLNPSKFRFNSTLHHVRDECVSRSGHSGDMSEGILFPDSGLAGSRRNMNVFAERSEAVDSRRESIVMLDNTPYI